MKINYGGIVRISTIDFADRSASVIFLRGCPFRCQYCHNHGILDGYETKDSTELEEEITKAKPFINGVLFTGGEPLVQIDAVKELAQFSKNNNLDVALNTNGYYYENIKDLVDNHLVDRISVDIKAPLDSPELYGHVIGYGKYNKVSVEPENVVNLVRKSTEYINENNVELELRTTVMKDVLEGHETIKQLISSLPVSIRNSNTTFVIQQGLPDLSMNDELHEKDIIDENELTEYAQIVKETFNNVWIRTKENGTIMV